MIVAKKREDPELKTDVADYLIEEDFLRVKAEKCRCGNRITPLAKRLQASNPGLKRKCFNCLLHEGKVKVVSR